MRPISRLHNKMMSNYHVKSQIMSIHLVPSLISYAIEFKCDRYIVGSMFLGGFNIFKLCNKS